MVSRINDSRIGIKGSNRRVVQLPSLFANDGSWWGRAGNPTPTAVYFGPEYRFFYLLAPGVNTVKPEIRAELEQIVNDAIAEFEANNPNAVPSSQPVQQPAPQPTVQPTVQAQPQQQAVQPSSLSQAEWGVQSPQRVQQMMAQDTGEGGLVIPTEVESPQAEPVEEIPVIDYPEYDDILPDMED